MPTIFLQYAMNCTFIFNYTLKYKIASYSNQFALFLFVLTMLKCLYSCMGELKDGNIEFVMLYKFLDVA